MEESQRPDFLREACAGDDDLRQDLEELFAEDPQLASFLETPALREIAPEFAATSTTAWVGREIGNYQFVSLLGTGGMGEVYRARDSNLKRDVAIKVLPDAFSRDAERVARFQREAHVLASLNHPHIGAIYDLKKFEDSQFLVLELVDGETLAERIARRPIPVHDALPIAKQIAEALEGAHAKAIIHRDLKPANIKVTPDGTIKVLDFGLAEVWETETTTPGVSDVSMMLPASLPGTIVGTAAYICPERAHGKPVDKRTDLWAFGCVLYEMLTGRPAFPGDTVSGTVAGILERDPDWRALPAATPSNVVRLLRRCLDKDPKRRLHDIADARIEIEDAISGDSLTPAETAVVDRRPVRLLWPIVAVFSVMALIALSMLTWYMRTPPRTSRLTLATSGAAAIAITNGRSLAITPDGKRVIYVGSSNQLFVRPLDQYDATPIFTGAAPLTWTFVSPDGQLVGFAEGNTIKKVPLSGGLAVTIAQASHTAVGATFAPEDTIIFATSDPSTGLQRMSAVGGAVATVLTRPVQAQDELDHLWPEMLPGGRAVLFTITSTRGLGAARVAVLDLATRKYKVLGVGSHAHYVPSGHLVYAAEGTLRAVPFDLNLLETRGTPAVVLPRLVTSSQGAGSFAVAADGTLAYIDAPGAEAAASTLTWVDREGREEALGTPPRPYLHPRLSPDGKQVAVFIDDQGHDIWVWDVAGHTLSQRTFDPAGDQSPVWTTDGKHLIFFSQRDGAEGLFEQSANGSGLAERLGAGIPSSVTPDGKYVILYRSAKDIVMMALDGTRPVEPLVNTSSIERNGVVSRNGHWLAYESDSSGQFEIYVRPFPNVEAGLSRISAAGGTRPLWSRNGQELFYVAPDGSLMAARVEPRGGAWSSESPVKVLEARYATTGVRPGRTYDVSLDGQRFLVIKPPAASQAGAPQISIVQGWFEELKRLVPVN